MLIVVRSKVESLSLLLPKHSNKTFEGYEKEVLPSHSIFILQILSDNFYSTVRETKQASLTILKFKIWPSQLPTTPGLIDMIASYNGLGQKMA